MNIRECLALTTDLHINLIERFYGSAHGFAGAWHREQEPRARLLFLIEALRYSQQDNGEMEPGEVVRLMLDLFVELTPLTVGTFCEGELQSLNEFLDRGRETCTSPTSTNFNTLYENIFMESDGEFVHRNPGNPAAAILVRLLEALQDLLSTLSAGRFRRITNADTTWETVLRRLRTAAHLIDLYARSREDGLDLRLSRLDLHLRTKGPTAEQVQRQLQRQHIRSAAGTYRCLLLLPTSAEPSHQTAYATLHDRDTGTLVGRVQAQGRTEAVDQSLRLVATPIEAVGAWTLYDIDTDRPVQLRHRQPNHPGTALDTDQVMGTFPSIRIWDQNEK